MPLKKLLDPNIYFNTQNPNELQQLNPIQLQNSYLNLLNSNINLMHKTNEIQNQVNQLNNTDNNNERYNSKKST